MGEEKAKKSSLINVLKVLQRYSDKDHRLTQKEIIDHLRQDIGVEVNRRTVKSNLEMLVDVGFKLRTGDGEIIDEDGQYTSLYLEPEFEDKELRLLINSVSSSRYITAVEAKAITDKLKALTDGYFRATDTGAGAVTKTDNSTLMDNMDTLHDAINSCCKVSFEYCSYDVDGKLHQRRDKEGNIKKYKVSPYRIVEINGRFYLLAYNPDHKGTMANFRVDKIINMDKLPGEAIVPSNKYSDVQAAISDLPGYLAAHINMSFGKTRLVTFNCRRSFINVIMDTFLPERVKVEKVTEDTVRCRVKVDTDAMRSWVMQYPDKIRVLEPKELADSIRESFRLGLENYSEE